MECSPKSAEGSPATINLRSVIHGVAHVLRLGVPSRELTDAIRQQQVKALHLFSAISSTG